MKPLGGSWKHPAEVNDKNVHIAWVNGTWLPSFWLLARDLRGKWTCQRTGKNIPEHWIGGVQDVPDPKEIGPDFMGEP